MARFFILLGILGVFGCDDEQPVIVLSPATGVDAGIEPDAGNGNDGGRADPDCGDDVMVGELETLEPPDAWREWDEETLACLRRQDIPTDGSFDDLTFLRTDAIEIDGESGVGALVCARGALVVHEDAREQTWLEGTLRRALVTAHVDEDDLARATEACGERLAGPNCGDRVPLDDLAPLRVPDQFSEWYAETLACLQDLDIEPRHSFDELSFWSSSSVAYSAICSDGSLVFPEAGTTEHAVRQAMAVVNVDETDKDRVTEACADELAPAP